MAEITRVFDLLKYCLENHPQEDMVAAKQNGTWNKYSTEKFVAQVNSVSLGLIASGIKKDDKVAIMSSQKKKLPIFCRRYKKSFILVTSLKSKTPL